MAATDLLRFNRGETDELLDQLREEEEKEAGSKTKSRPKFQAKSRQSLSLKTPASNPPTLAQELKTDSTEPWQTLSSENEKIPISRRHREHNTNQEELISTTPQLSAGDLGAATLDGVDKRSGSGGNEEGGGRGSREQSGWKRRERRSTTIEFDDKDEDDLLSGMGLDDGPTTNITKRTPDLQKNKVDKLKESTEKHKIPSKDENNKESEENYTFGGYAPSMSLTSSGSRRRKGLPPALGRNRGREIDPPDRGSLSSHPVSSNGPHHQPPGGIGHTASSQAIANTSTSEATGKTQVKKKSVRFSVEQTELKTPIPSSQPAEKEDQEEEKVTSQDQTTASPLQQSQHQISDGEKRELKIENFEQKLEHPAFPWQEKRLRRRDPNHPHTNSKSTNPFTDSTHDPEPQPAVEVEKNGRNPFTENSTSSSEKLLLEGDQQERSNSSMKEWSNNRRQLNNQSSSELREPSETESLKTSLKSLENEMKLSEQERQLLAEKLKTAEEEKREQLVAQKSKEHELTSLVEELKAKVYRMECEKNQLNSLVETIKSHNTEEQATLEKSHSARIQAVEESFQRREASWKEEREVETARQRQKLEETEREKIDSLLALKKKMESLELSKNNEISQLQDIHRSTVADMKREREMDLNRLKDTHRQEIEALKSAHSHTQRLTELSGQLEELTGRVSGLQTRVGQTHQHTQSESQQNYYTHQQHLKILEDRLSKQCRDVESERELLRSLASRLDSQLTQQTQTMEQERWSLQQDSARVKAAERALEEQRSVQLARLEQEKREMIESKEKFLVEQQKLLLECLNERHSLAAERAQLTVEKNIFIETEKKETHQKHQREMELEVQLAKVIEEKGLLSRGKAQLQQTEVRLRCESVQLEHEKQVVEKERANLLERMDLAESSGQEANTLNLSAVAIQREGEEMKEEALRLQAELAKQAEAMRRERQKLEERENQLVSDRLAFACECREYEEKQKSILEPAIPHFTPILSSTRMKSGNFREVTNLSSSLPHLDDNYYH